MKIPDRRRFGASHIPLAAILALATLPVSAPMPAAAAGQLLPDLQMAAPYNIQVQKRPKDKRLLRFGTIVWNVGDGPLEVRANRRVGNRMTRIVQRIRLEKGGTAVRQVPNATAFYSGDGHNHWHIGRFINVSLTAQAPAPAASDAQRHLRKLGFCLVDLVRAPTALRPLTAVAKRGYKPVGCGRRKSAKLQVGISVGWGDDYRPFFTHQQINVTGLPAGIYRLCATVNPEGLWLEKGANSANNSYWFDLNIDAAAATVTPVGHGLGPCTSVAPTT